MNIRWLVGLLLIVVLVPSTLAAKQTRKPGASVEILAPATIVLDAGETRDITLTFSAPAAGNVLQLELLKLPGLQLVSDTRRWQFSDVDARVTLRLQADKPGKYPLQVLATTWPEASPEQRTSRVLGIAVLVGGAAQRQKLSSPSPDLRVKTRADGSRSVEFMAEETVQ